MTEEDRKWPLPPVVYRGLEEIDGEVQIEEDARGGGDTSLPAPFVATGFSPSDAIPVDALPMVPAEPRVEAEEPEADSRPETFRVVETPVGRFPEVPPEVIPEGGPLAAEAPLSAVEAEVEDEEVKEEEVEERMEWSEELEVAPEATPPLTSYPSGPMASADLGAEAEEPLPVPSSPQEDMAVLLERLAVEIRAKSEIRLDGGSGSTPLEGLLRGMLAGYLAHVRKGPG